MMSRQLGPDTIIEAFRYIFNAFFQPARLTRELKWVSQLQCLTIMLKLFIPMFLVAYPLAIACEAFLHLFGTFRYIDFTSLLLESTVDIGIGLAVGIGVGMAVGVVSGVVGGIVGSIAGGLSVAIGANVVGSISISMWSSTANNIMITMAIGIGISMAISIAVGIAAGITAGIPIGITESIALGIAGGMSGGVAVGIAVGITAGIAVSIALGIRGGIMGGVVISVLGGITAGILSCIAVGMLGCMAGYIVGGIMGGIVGGIAGGIKIFLGIYRLLLYTISGPSMLLTYMVSRKRPYDALMRLRRSSLHWDERVFLPLPFLKQTLLIIYDEDPQGALEEITFIATERPQQLSAARAVVLEIAMHDLESRKTILQISGASTSIRDILSLRKILYNSRSFHTLRNLSNISQDIRSSIQPIGRQARIHALEKAIQGLKRIHPNVAFRDQRLNQRLNQVIETWLAVAQEERERIEHIEQDIGNIDNPYKPGQVLDPHDPLFVGRRDLVQKLEYALRKRRPTLLLQSERRMGKTSTLRQLSYLLGTSYIPILYNLQAPEIYAHLTTLLNMFARDIHNELRKRGIEVEHIPLELSQESSTISDPVAYSIFDHWLKGIEKVLEAEDHSLLLAFDEFEKLDEMGGKGYLNLTLFLDWCRQVIQYRPRIILLFSGLHNFSDMGAETGLNWSNYFVNVQTFKVSFLNRNEVSRLVIHPRPDYPGEEIFGEVVEQIIQYTNCHPFLVQAICSQLIDNLNIEKGKRVTPAHMMHAVKQVVDSWDSYFDDLWKRSDESQRTCLSILSSQKQEWASPIDIQQHSYLDEESIKKALRNLVKRDLIIRHDDETYRIAVPIFSDWMKDNA
jgi:uncharacterized protein